MSSTRPQPPRRSGLPEGLNAAQLGAVQAAVRDVVEQLKLRQWCVEKAIETDVVDRVALAREFFAFVSEVLPTVIEAEEAE